MISKEETRKLVVIGERFRVLRKEKGMSLRETSAGCNIDNSKIAKIEKGQINITTTTFLDLCMALETQPRFFFTDAVEEALGFLEGKKSKGRGTKE